MSFVGVWRAHGYPSMCALSRSGSLSLGGIYKAVIKQSWGRPFSRDHVLLFSPRSNKHWRAGAKSNPQHRAEWRQRLGKSFAPPSHVSII